jgi:tRNA threonylcarbamoyladenosine biosynthesis protein TsaE
MNTDSPAARIITRSAAETRSLGSIIGGRLESNVVITLTGDLGSGKTVFVQGLASGLGVPEHYYITSPTYTLVNEYPGRLRLFHVDLYRLDHAAEIEDIGLDEMISIAVVAIEWADKLPGSLLAGRIHLRFEIVDETSRKISLFGYGLQLSILLKGLEKIT